MQLNFNHLNLIPEFQKKLKLKNIQKKLLELKKVLINYLND